MLQHTYIKEQLQHLHNCTACMTCHFSLIILDIMQTSCSFPDHPADILLCPNLPGQWQPCCYYMVTSVKEVMFLLLLVCTLAA